MMEQPTTGKEAGIAKSESPGQDPNPNPNLVQINTPDPDPKPDNAATSAADVKNTHSSSSTIDIDLNESSNINSSSSSINSEEKLRSKKSVQWSKELVMESSREYSDSNPYVNHAPVPNPNSSSSASSFNFKEAMGSVKDVLGRWGKKVGEATKKAEDLAGNTWQHLKTSPSLADAALGRIAQGTKVLAEGGYEKIFQQTFETVPEEKLKDSFACYLSTSAGPVMGVLYVSTEKLAFSSDTPLSYQAADKTEWSYYKVVIPLHQLKAVNPSTSRTNSAEKYIQVISVDNHEFWYMGFLNYGGAVERLQEALQARDAQSV